MATPIKTLIDEITTISASEKRPERMVRAYVRDRADKPFAGEIRVDDISKTIAYTRSRDLRDGNTVRSNIKDAGYKLEIQIDKDIQASVDSMIDISFVITKFDGFSRTIYGHQVETTPLDDADGTADVQSDEEIAEGELAADDPLAAFQAEALEQLASDRLSVIFDTSGEEAMFDQLQDEAELQLSELIDDVEQSTSTPIENSVSDASDEPVTPDLTLTDAEEESVVEPANVKTLTPPLDDDFVAGDIADIHHEHLPLPSEPLAPLPPSPLEQPVSTAAALENVTDPITPASVPEDELTSLLDDALGDADTPITLDLLAAIVSLQTGIPSETVAAIQKRMWTHLSDPATFGEGKKKYKFPGFGNFTVRKSDGDVSLEFVSKEISSISSANVNESVTFTQANQYVENASGPLVARHVVPLALSTATSLGLQQAQAYLTIYRTVLLLLRIFARGERRIRIDEVGEFFPGIVAGAEAYRFRAYPALLRATSAAFRDATAFLSQPGQAQQAFDGVRTSKRLKRKIGNGENPTMGLVAFIGVVLIFILTCAFNNS